MRVVAGTLELYLWKIITDLHKKRGDVLNKFHFFYFPLSQSFKSAKWNYSHVGCETILSAVGKKSG